MPIPERVVELSQKKDDFIQIGQTRRRIAKHHRAMLVELQKDFPYCSMEDLLFQTSLIGLMVTRSTGIVPLISVRS